MKAVLSLSIGDISMSVRLTTGSFFGILKKRYQYFLTDTAADYTIDVDVLPKEYFSQIQVQDTDKPLVTISRDGPLTAMERLDNPFIASLRGDNQEVHVSMRESPYCFDSFLRVLLVVLLAGKGGVLLHSCAIDDHGRGRVFFGPSESGKTTIARLARNRVVLSDEIAIIRPSRNGKYFVYGTPFWGEFQAGKNNRNVQLSSMYSLSKSPVSKVVPISTIDAINHLHRCVLYFGTVPEISDQILETCVSISQNVPIFGLNFSKDDGFWSIINSGEMRVNQ